MKQGGVRALKQNLDKVRRREKWKKERGSVQVMDKEREREKGGGRRVVREGACP